MEHVGGWDSEIPGGLAPVVRHNPAALLDRFSRFSLRAVRGVATWKSRHVLVLPLVYCIADMLETLVTMRLFGCLGFHPCTFPSEQPFLWISVLSLVKWVALLLAVTAIMVGFMRPDVHGRINLKQAWDKLRGPGRPVGSAGGLSVVVVAFALVIALPAGGPLDQIPDIIRSQAVGDKRDAAMSVVAAAVLVVTVLIAGLWSIELEKDPEPAQPDPEPWRARSQVLVGALLLSLLLALAQYMFDGNIHWTRWGQPAAPFLTVSVIMGVSWVVRRWTPKNAEGAAHASTRNDEDQVPNGGDKPTLGNDGHTEPDRDDPWDDRKWRAVALLVALVVFALGLGLVRAFAPVVFGGTPAIKHSKSLLLLGGVTAAVVAPVLALLITVALRHGLDNLLKPCSVLGTAVTGWTVVAAVLLAVNPELAWGGATGALATCFAFFATLTGLLGLASHRFRWSDTQSLGLGARTPWAFILILCWLLASTLDFDGGYHDARAGSKTSANPPTIKERFKHWRDGWDEKTIKKCSTKNGKLPMVLVAAPGGGGKAAYWTGHTMDELFGEGRPLCPESLFAVSGVSGGAVGLTVTLGDGPRATNKDHSSHPLARLTDDEPISQLVVAMLLRDLPQPFIGAVDGWADRAEVFETSWEEATAEPTTGSGPLGTPRSPRSIDQLGAGWSTYKRPSHGGPLIVLNSASVTDGCRVLLSNTAELPSDARSCRSAVNDAAWSPAGPVAVSLDARAGLVDSAGTPRNENAGGEPCGGEGQDDLMVADMRSSTAALMAARFPYMTPSGALRRCVPSKTGGTQRTTYGVDGGYIENTGLPALMEVWNAVSSKIERCNAADDCPTGGVAGLEIEPWVILLENHYRSRADAPDPRRPKELWVPLQAFGSSGTLRSSLALENQAAALMYKPLPSLGKKNRFVMIAPFNKPTVQAPLGWALAEPTRASMRNDVDKAIRHYCGTDLFREVGKCAPPNAQGAASR